MEGWSKREAVGFICPSSLELGEGRERAIGIFDDAAVYFLYGRWYTCNSGFIAMIQPS